MSLRQKKINIAVTPVVGGYGVTLDGVPLRTPENGVVMIPGKQLAELVANELCAFMVHRDPKKMRVNNLVRIAIDRIGPNRVEAIAQVMAYSQTDLVCYRCQEPLELCMRQEAAWNPLLDWAYAELGACLRTTKAVMPISQPLDAVGRLRVAVEIYDNFQLAAFQNIVTLTGSLVLALAVTVGGWAPDEVWELTRIDEDWQAENWGVDREASVAASRMRQAFLESVRLFSFCEPETTVRLVER